jgi:hypothetical protein
MIGKEVGDDIGFLWSRVEKPLSPEAIGRAIELVTHGARRWSRMGTGSTWLRPLYARRCRA